MSSAFESVSTSRLLLQYTSIQIKWSCKLDYTMAGKNTLIKTLIHYNIPQSRKLNVFERKCVSCYVVATRPHLFHLRLFVQQMF